MLDIRLIREDPEQVKKRLATRGGGDEARIGEIAVLDEQRRKLIADSDALKAQRNQASKEIGLRKGKGQEVSEQMTEMKQVGDRIAALDTQLSTLDSQLQSILLMIPNLPHE